jgi:hypothetical protein
MRFRCVTFSVNGSQRTGLCVESSRLLSTIWSRDELLVSYEPKPCASIARSGTSPFLFQPPMSILWFA